MSRVPMLRFACLLFGLTLAGTAIAQPVFRGHAYDYRSGRYVPAPQVPHPAPYPPPVTAYAVPAPVAPPVPAPVAPPPAPAYAVPVPAPVLPQGWVYARPANCGVYKYWNGHECLDARYDPPDLRE